MLKTLIIPYAIELLVFFSILGVGKHISVFCQDLHASDSFHNTRSDSVVLQWGWFLYAQSTTLCGYTQVVSIDDTSIDGY